MSKSELARAFQQLIDGWDVPAPKSLLRISPARAAHRSDCAPYSILTNLAHTVLWQDHWLQKIKGGPLKPSMEMWANDFREPDAAEFGELRRRFLDGLEEARQIAETDPLRHRMRSEQDAVDTLYRILLHASYHVGQINVLKRMN